MAAAQTSSLRWAGLIQEAFTNDGDVAWTVEDGGRIRHRAANGTWSFQTTPAEVEDSLRRVFFLSNNLDGWAVGLNGWVLETDDGGTTWTQIWKQQSVAVPTVGEDLWDTHWCSVDEGYILGLHGIWRTTNPHGSHPWSNQATFWTSTDPQTAVSIDPLTLELYALDIHPNGLALACGEPGVIFKRSSTNHDRWETVFDIRELCNSNPSDCDDSPPLPTCAAQYICCEDLRFELWDIEISRHATQPLAIAVGGGGSICGLILTSLDNGVNWGVESHECGGPSAPFPCGSDPLYSDDMSSPSDTWRLRKYRTLYNVGILHGDNTAIACGYGGQIVVRDPADSDPNTAGDQIVWRDRSDYSNVLLTTPDATTLPGYGVATNSGNGQTGKAFVTSMGGTVRRSIDGGQGWATELDGEEWRIRDVHFIDSARGWMVSQFYRIARSTDGGTTWLPDQTDSAMNKGFLQAIAFSDTGDIGVAVGDPEPGKWPEIVFNDDALASTAWLEGANLFPVEPELVVTAALREVTWASGVEFWAVGDQGLILHSSATAGPSTWIQFVPSGESYSSFSDFAGKGVSFSGASNGVIVGSRSPSGVTQGKAYHYKASEPTKLTTIAVPNEPTLIELTDVAFDGTSAYATGYRSVSGIVTGVVFKATFSNGAFGDLVAVGSTFDECMIGDGLTSAYVLEEVEIAPGGTAWIGGQCGRIWKWDAAGVDWLPIRSLTDAHIQGMSFPASDSGFAAGYRANRTSHVIVRIVP